MQGERVRGEITSSKGQEVKVIISSKGQEARSKNARSNYKEQAARSKKSGSKKKKKKKRRRRSRRRRRRRRSLKFEGCIVDLELVHYQQQGARSYYKQHGARSKKQEGKKQLLAARGKKQERKNTRSNYKATGKKSGCKKKKKKKKLEGCNLDLGLAHYQQQGARSYNKKQSFGAWAVMLELVSSRVRK